jgi:hypothetical protein
MDDLERQRQAHLLVARGTGGVLSWFGVALIGVFLWLVYVMVTESRPFSVGLVSFLTGLFVVGAFCLVVGFRMYLNRPNRYGSVLTPTGWNVLGLFFATGAVALGTTAFFAPPGPAIGAGAGCATMSFGCFYCARKLRRN